MSGRITGEVANRFKYAHSVKLYIRIRILLKPQSDICIPYSIKASIRTNKKDPICSGIYKKLDKVEFQSDSPTDSRVSFP